METGKPLSFQTDIRPMFTDTDIAHMATYGLDLATRDGVAASAAQILTTVRSGAMPPPAEKRTWSKEMSDTFEAWIGQGCPP
jgi:tyrosinase